LIRKALEDFGDDLVLEWSRKNSAVSVLRRGESDG